MKVTPTSASHVEVGFIDDRGQPVRLNAGGYFEPGYVGEIEIAVQDGKVTRSVGQPLPKAYSLRPFAPVLGSRLSRCHGRCRRQGMQAFRPNTNISCSWRQRRQRLFRAEWAR